jgi:molybdopterin-guanine dinucleotide biosynthesis protein A
MKLTAIILAGGKSSRMGEDKGLMLFNGKPMIQYIIDTIKPLVDDVMIIANQEDYNAFGYPVYADLIKDSGPLAGIYTGLHYSKTEKNIVLSCDVPFVTKEVINELIANCENVDGVICENEGRTHQLIGVYDKSNSDFFKNELENGQRKIKLVLQKLNVKTINLNHFDNKIFNNINSKDDIKA